MNFSELVDTVWGKSIGGVSRAKVEITLKRTFSALCETLGAGQSVSIRGFGTFSIYHNKTGMRNAYNFVTKETMKVPCKPKIRFKASFPVGG